MEYMISVVIPSCKDPHLQRTIDDLRSKAEGQLEIVVVLDGVFDNVKNADIVLFNEQRKGMRASINRGVAASHGEYIMKVDAHCMFGPGWDRLLLSNIEDNWVVIPRRYKLDVDKWEIIDEPPIDYEKLFIDRPDKIGGVHWTGRRIERENIMIDENMVFQGSCWFMSRKHWNWLGDLQEEGYGTFTQEPIELALKTWLGGGKVMTNKLTWYAHKHRKYGRTMRLNSDEITAGNLYSKDFWLNNRWDKRIHDIDWLFTRFGLKYNPYKL
jgi:glycosyltransferase involved in cell wall biosynthesis